MLSQLIQNNHKSIFHIVFTMVLVGSSFSMAHVARATQTENITFDTESDYIQEDAINGTDFDSGNIFLQGSGVSVNDDFSGSSINSARWQKIGEAGTVAIQSGQLNLTVPTPGNNPQINHLATVGAGDFDVQVDFNNFSPVGGASYWATLMFISSDGQGHMQANRNNQGYLSRVWQNGTMYQGSTSTSVTGGKLRLTRVGSIGTVYAWNGSSWNSLFSHATNVGSGSISLYDGTIEGTLSCNFDNFILTGDNITPPSALLYPTTPYYVSTGDGSQLDTSAWSNVDAVSITQTTPANTNIKYLVSFDDRTTWKYWDGSSWQTSELASIATNGMTQSVIESLASAQWSQVFTKGTFDVAASFASTDGSNTPTLSNIAVSYSIPLDVTIQDPSPADINSAVNNGYFTLNSGTITNTQSVTTTVNVTVQDTIFNAVFPTNTTITETTNQPFNFQNLTAQNVTNTVQQEQPTSRAAVRIGIPGEKLNFSQLVTLTVSIGEAFNGQTLDILYQEEGESTWNPQGTCTVTNGLCTFQTNHATIYTVNGNHQTTGDTPMNLNVEIQETLSMDCFDPSDSNTTVSLGTTTNPGMITAGTPAVGQSRCTVTTNADQGYYLTLTNANPSHATLTHTDPHTATLYEITDQTPWNETAKTTQNWISPTTKGLAFSVITFPESNTTHNQFNGVWNQTNQCPEGVNPDTNDYAGIPTTPQAISAVTSYQSSATTTNICYKVDVPASQPSGQYSGQVMFTATSDASGYYQ